MQSPDLDSASANVFPADANISDLVSGRLEIRIFSPSMVILPETLHASMVSFILFRQRRKVDLPQPDRPTEAVAFLSSLSTSTSLTA
jgi:hypothetical protein